MIRLAARRLWTRRLQALAPLVALLAATLGFQAVLVSARSTQSHVQGVIAANWNPPYDLLVHPASLVTGLKPGDRLIQPNYLDSARGGITMQQVAAVRKVSGVAVAAPLGVVTVDYLEGEDYAIDLTKLPRSGNLNVYRITTSFTTDAGQSVITQKSYALVEGTQPPFIAGTYGPSRTPMQIGGYVVDCPDHCYGPVSVFPKQGANRTSQLALRSDWAANLFPYATWLTAPVVAVDPSAENALFGTSQCLVSGRDLTSKDVVGVKTPTRADPTSGNDDNPSSIPVILNARPGFDDRIHVTIDASGDALPELQPSLSTLKLEGGTVRRYLELPMPVLDALKFHPAGSIDTDLNTAWNASTGVGFTNGSIYHRAVDAARGTVSPIVYSGTVPRLTAVPAAPSVVGGQGADSFDLNLGSIDESQDVPFHSYTTVGQPVSPSETLLPWHTFNVVGKYDPACVSRQSALAKTAYDVYANPDTSTPGGQTMGPNASITNFSPVMPLVVTNLAGGAFFSDPNRFANGMGNAFLSVIRVRVRNTEVPGAASQARLERVAAAIQRATGLSVDIIKGSSPQPISIALPAGGYGRPAETVTQQWLTENVAISFFTAINSTTVVMSIVVTVVAILLTMQTTYATVRRRRGELVLLRAIGWPSWRIALLMELEVVTLGMLVALIALVFAGVMIVLSRPDAGALVGILLACPAAFGLTAVAGFGPALTASRTKPLAALRGPGRLRPRGRGLIRGPVSLGIREALTTWRWQTLLGAFATAVGAVFLGAMLAVIHDFHASLDQTALAQQLSNEVGPFDVLLGALAVAMGVTTAVSVVLVATRERLPHFATLRALGWSQAKVASVVAGQSMAVGLLGGVLAVIALSVVANRVKTGIALTLVSQLSPLLVGAFTGMAAAVGAMRLVYRRVIVTVLRAG